MIVQTLCILICKPLSLTYLIFIVACTKIYNFYRKKEMENWKYSDFPQEFMLLASVPCGFLIYIEMLASLTLVPPFQMYGVTAGMGLLGMATPVLEIF